MTPEPLQTNRQVEALHDRAMNDLRYIRKTMERAGAFTAVSGWGQVLAGSAALAAGVIAFRQSTIEGWLTTWLAAAVVAFAISALTSQRKAQAAGESLFSAPGRKFLLSFVPALVVGAFAAVVGVILALLAVIAWAGTVVWGWVV